MSEPAPTSGFDGLAAFVRHEMAPVLMTLRMLADCPSEPDPQILAASVEHVERILDALSELEHGTAGPVGTEPLASALSSAVLLAAGGRKVDLDIGSTGSMLVPAPHSRLILRNMVSNAFAHAVPPVRVSAELRGDGLLVCVHDGGRAPVRYPGMGLGDSICSTLAASCGMSASFSRQDEGSVSRLLIPSV